MTVKLFATRDRVPQRGEEFARSFENFGDRVNESLIIARLMSLNRWRDRRHDIHTAAASREKNFNAGACGLCRFDKDKLVFVRNDHGPVPERTGNTTQSVGRLVNAREFARNRRMDRNLAAPSDDLFSETISVRSHTEDGR